MGWPTATPFAPRGRDLVEPSDEGRPTLLPLLRALARRDFGVQLTKPIGDNPYLTREGRVVLDDHQEATPARVDAVVPIRLNDADPHARRAREECAASAFLASQSIGTDMNFSPAT